MSDMPVQPPRSVLISGASIAGPALAYWLDRYGFEVTVVERASAVRSGGYPIDIRGTAIEAIDRMGLKAQVRDAHIASRALTFVDAAGNTVGTVPIYDLTGNELDEDVEVPRGTLTTLLYDLTRNGRVRYRFEDSIDTLDDDGTAVDVGFSSGERGRYDVVIGADGIHSHTRELTFGPEAPFSRYLGATFNLFSLPNDLGLSHGVRAYSEPGRTALVMAVRDSARLFAMLTFATDSPPFGGQADRAEQIRRTAAVFADGGWEVPRLLAAMERADDLFFDTVSQIHMPRWSKGRVALVGDAAFAPSFRSGQGTSLALVGAYVLAGELAAHKDACDAFAAYEQIVRPFAEANQALAIKEDGDLILPRTPQELEARNRLLAELAAGKPIEEVSGKARAAHSALTLPDYGYLVREQG